MHRNNFLYKIIIFFIATCLYNLSFYKDDTFSKDIAPYPSGEETQNEALRNSVADSLKTETENLKVLIERTANIDNLKAAIAGEINAYRTQHTTYINILLLPKTEIKDLEKAASGSRTSLLNIEERLREIKTEFDSVKQNQIRLDEQYETNKSQLEGIRSQGSRTSESLSLENQLKSLIKVLDKKKTANQRLIEFYANRIQLFEDIQNAFQTFNEKIEKQIRERKRQELLQRKEYVFSTSIVTKTIEEFRFLEKETRFICSKSFWKQEALEIWKTGGSFFILFVILFCLTQILLVRFRRFCGDLKERPFYAESPTFRLMLLITERSILLLGVTVFLFAYTIGRPVSPLVSLTLFILQILLFTRWGVNLLDFLSQTAGTQISKQLRIMAQFLIRGIRYYAYTYVIIAYVLNSDSSLLFIIRVLFETSFAIWSFFFGKAIKKTYGGEENSRKNKHIGSFTSGFCLVIAIGALSFEIAGYGSLANYWYLSWGKSAVVLLWGYLLFFSLREWNLIRKKNIGEDESAMEKVEAPVKWLIYKIAQIVLMALLIVCLVISWGGRQAILLNFFKVLNYTLTLGNMKINLLGCIYFILILLITDTAARLWKYFFQNKLLSRSGIELGLQDSITTITVYLIWTVGVLISLHAVGMNTTSIAVALGALGIGLGFGLQNIFNNFLSGIILLFERPIQVGDDLEVGGKWGMVKKINVRSTVVQTYDNASLIIPNSELISTQVTNWSFKDKRLRRQIAVGVAYGSDIELVRKSLLEVAEKTSRVLKYPKPDVIFTDFGDNALIFKLRFWTHVSYFLAVETDVRFEIDRLFKERGLTIAFPQRDVHIFYENKKTED